MPHRSYSYRSVTHWLPIARLTVGLLVATLALLTRGLHAPATTPAIADTGDSTIRPILFTTEAEIARAKKRVEDQQQPFYEAWQKTRAQADAALTTTYVPEESYNHETYFGIARPQAQDTRLWRWSIGLPATSDMRTRLARFCSCGPLMRWPTTIPAGAARIRWAW